MTTTKTLLPILMGLALVASNPVRSAAQDDAAHHPGAAHATDSAGVVAVVEGFHVALARRDSTRALPRILCSCNYREGRG